MKRMMAPKFWPIKRKEKKFVGTPSPGPHSSKFSIPMTVLLRDMLSFAVDAKEAQQILTSRKVKVNGKVRTDKNYPSGLMDIIEIGDYTYRVIADKRGLALSKIDKKNAFQMFQIKNKCVVKKAKVQINLHNGSNMLSEGISSAMPASSRLSTGDVLIVKAGKVEDILPFEKGATALIINGNNAGVVGKIESIVIKKGSHGNEVIMETEKEKLLVPMDYVFVVGRGAPVIELNGDANV